MIKQIMKFSGIIIGAAGIIEKDGKFLLTKRSKLIAEGGKWCLPGGHVKKWEKAEKALEREIMEELGVKSKSSFLFVKEEFRKDLNLHAVTFVFKTKLFGKIKPNWEVSEVKFFSKKEIMDLDMAFTHKEMLKRYWDD